MNPRGKELVELLRVEQLHDTFRFDEWVLYATDSPAAGHARGFVRGSRFAHDGRLVASTAPEGLIRLRRPV